MTCNLNPLALTTVKIEKRIFSGVKHNAQLPSLTLFFDLNDLLQFAQILFDQRSCAIAHCNTNL